MGILVYVLGKSGTGKSYSMRNFPKEKLTLINVQGKILPFRGSGEIKTVVTDDSGTIVESMKGAAEMNFKSIVIDDFQYVMANEFMRRSMEKGYDKFTEIGRHAWDIPDAVRDLPNDCIVYVMCHTDRDDEGNEKIKTIGKLLDEKICLEGMSTIVLKTNVTDGKYVFLTQNNGKDTTKSPAGMFPTYAIDNDLWYVDQKIRNYYFMEGAKTDEEIKEADAEAVVPEIEKTQDSGRGRRRARTTTEAPKTEASTQEEPKTAVMVDDKPDVNRIVGDEPIRRTRKRRERVTEPPETDFELMDNVVINEEVIPFN